ncbi:hypothetical protein FBY22_3699 [Streptomyces sp. SLBN-31]|nr:hypothetical protein FBY22_3699 [Streptomyces sp. SLBN-31]
MASYTAAGRAEIVPLSTLTHELEGVACWQEVGDRERATQDLLSSSAVTTANVLNVGVPEIARAL